MGTSRVAKKVSFGIGWLRKEKSIHSINAVASDFRYEPKGAWVYHTEGDWDFEKFNTLDDAVIHVIKNLNSKGTVMCRGKEIRFCKVNDERAYFIDFDGKAKLVEL